MAEKKYNILSFYLACYIALLPFFAVWHTLQHFFENSRDDVSVGVFVSMEKEADCEICAYYFDPLEYFETATIHHFKTVFSTLQKKRAVHLPHAIKYQKYLRGPPLDLSFPFEFFQTNTIFI